MPGTKRVLAKRSCCYTICIFSDPSLHLLLPNSLHSRPTGLFFQEPQVLSHLRASTAWIALPLWPERILLLFHGWHQMNFSRSHSSYTFPLVLTPLHPNDYLCDSWLTCTLLDPKLQEDRCFLCCSVWCYTLNMAPPSWWSRGLFFLN